MSVMRPAFATFWAEETLSAFEKACARSFVTRGYQYTVYSYREVENLPEGVTQGNARAITEEANVRRFLIDHRPNLSHFSDLFRYELFRRTDYVWVDMDMLMLRPLDLPHYDQLLAKEEPSSLCGAIMRLEGTHPSLDMLIARTKKLRDKELVWGATGPRLLTSVFGPKNAVENAYAPKFFFPIHFNEAWKVFLPEFQDECVELCQSAYTLHLWNDRMIKLGVWKRFCPPVGSFLETQFRTDGSADFFDGVYPADVMRNMVENWRFRCEGGDIGLGQWIRHAIPSAQLTFRRRLSLPTRKVLGNH